MKTSIAVATALALALATATGASAYSFNPPDASVRLHGKLTFTPNEGGQTKPFTCSVTIDFKTKRNLITAVKFLDKNCGAGLALPWHVAIANANSGVIGGGGFDSSPGNCVENENLFQVNGSGIWTLPPGECISGTLTSHPPTTIVP